MSLRRVCMNEDTIELDHQSGREDSRRSSKKRHSIDLSSGNETSFAYEKFFHEQIDAKKRDNSYRIFKRIERQQNLFPRANEQLNPHHSRSITVWCSNDYLGLSQHPQLKQAVM